MNSSEIAESTAGSSSVLDASAVLALILQESGREVVADVVREGAYLSAINLSEVITRLLDLGYSAAAIQADLEALELDVVELDRDIAWRVGLLRPATRHAGLSLGDRCCLALAGVLGLSVLTADRRWTDLNVGVKVILCR
jgi:ribonuclease VapC